MSLGSWFRSYLYIPLGGNRKGLKMQMRNIAIVWLATGIWHGASWNFGLWGVYFGVFLILEKFLWLDFLKKHKIFSHIYTLVIVWIGWALFAFDDMGRVAQYLKALFGLSGAGFVNGETLYLFLSYGVMLVILILASTPYPKQWVMKLMDLLEDRKQEKAVEAKSRASLGSTVSIVLQLAFVAVIFIISTAYLVDATYNPFLYFRF